MCTCGVSVSPSDDANHVISAGHQKTSSKDAGADQLWTEAETQNFQAFFNLLQLSP